MRYTLGHWLLFWLLFVCFLKNSLLRRHCDLVFYDTCHLITTPWFNFSFGTLLHVNLLPFPDNPCCHLSNNGNNAPK